MYLSFLIDEQSWLTWLVGNDMEVHGRSLHACVRQGREWLYGIYEWTFDATCVTALNRVCVCVW